MEEDKRLQAAGALAAIVAFVLVVVQFAGGRAAPKASSGPGWYSRINPFGSAPSADPSPAYERPAPELAAPERVLTNAASRQFSSPTSAGSSGGLAGAEPVSAPAAAATPMSAPRLSGSGYVDLPGGGNAPVSSAGASFAPPPAARTNAPPPGRGGSPVAAASAPSGGARASGAGASPGGDTQSAASAASSFGRAAGAGVAGGSTAGGSRLGAMDANGVSSRAPGLNETPKLSGSSAGGGGAGPGDLGGGGGAGKGGSGGMGGAVPGGKPKESAGKPAGADAGGGAPAGGSPAGDASAPGSINGGQPSEVRSANSVIGAPQMGSVTVRGAVFKSHPDGPADVPTTVYVLPNGTKPIKFDAKMAIDADGAGGAWRGDRTGQPKTSLLYKNGDSLNPREIPFIVVPVDFHKTYPNVMLGDYAAVTYGAKTLFAIIGDKGPAGVLGEGSMSLASGLGINPDPNRGGITRKDVNYVILPGTRDPEPPRDAGTIQSRGKAVFDAAGAPVR